MNVIPRLVSLNKQTRQALAILRVQNSDVIRAQKAQPNKKPEAQVITFTCII